MDNKLLIVNTSKDNKVSDEYEDCVSKLQYNAKIRHANNRYAFFHSEEVEEIIRNIQDAESKESESDSFSLNKATLLLANEIIDTNSWVYFNLRLVCIIECIRPYIPCYFSKFSKEGTPYPSFMSSGHTVNNSFEDHLTGIIILILQQKKGRDEIISLSKKIKYVIAKLFRGCFTVVDECDDNDTRRTEYMLIIDDNEDGRIS